MDFELPYRKPHEKGGTPDREFFTFPDPGLLPEELTYVPGFINELTDWTMEMSQSPHRVIAFVDALMMLAHLTGRVFRTPPQLEGGLGRVDQRKAPHAFHIERLEIHRPRQGRRKSRCADTVSAPLAGICRRAVGV